MRGHFVKEYKEMKKQVGFCFITILPLPIYGEKKLKNEKTKKMFSISVFAQKIEVSIFKFWFLKAHGQTTINLLGSTIIWF